MSKIIFLKSVCSSKFWENSNCLKNEDKNRQMICLEKEGFFEMFCCRLVWNKEVIWPNICLRWKIVLCFNFSD